jgi:tetratricopeptide (TPR) repeat protein
MKEVKQMQKEHELIKKDYASLLAQMKDLLADSRRGKEMESLLEKDKASMALLEKEKVTAKAENIVLKNKVKRLEELEKKLAKDKQGGGYDGESSARKLKIKELRAEDINTREAALLTQSQPNDAQAKELQSKLEAEKKQLSRQVDEYKKKYLNELERNNLAAQGGSDLPQKFSEVVKKNEELLKETAGMHYNLGVFFIKNKEYDRAIVEFEKAIEIYPEDPYSYYNLGYIYAQYSIDRSKAVKYFRQFLQFVKNEDKDVEWVKDYLLTWEAYK